MQMTKHHIDVLFEAVAKIISFICVVLLIGLIAINSLEIILRSIFNTSLFWITETNIMVASSIYFLGIAVIYHQSKEVRATIVTDRFPPKFREIYFRVIELLCAVVYAIVAWFTWKLIVLQSPFHTPGVGFPRIVYTVPLLVGLCVIALECFWRAFSGARPAPRIDHAELST